MMKCNPWSTSHAAGVMAMASLLLSACTSPQLESRISAKTLEVPVHVLPTDLGKSKAAFDGKEIEDKALNQQKPSLVSHSKAPWIGGSLVPTTRVDELPAIFQQTYTMDFGDGRVSIAVVAARLTKITGVPVRVNTDVFEARVTTEARPAATAPQLPVPATGTSPLRPPANARAAPSMADIAAQALISSSVSSTTPIAVDGVAMRWNGRLRDFLDHLTNVLSLSWEYRDGAIVIMRMVTQTHWIAAVPGQQKYAFSTGGSGSGAAGQGTGSSQSMQSSAMVSEESSWDAVRSIVDSVRTIIEPVKGSKLIFNAGTGTFMVTSSKEVQAQVRDYLNAENKKLRQMVNVTFDVYSVKVNDKSATGMDWSVIFNSLSANYGAKIISPSSLVEAGAGALSYAKIGDDLAGSTAILSAMRQFGNSVQHRPISLTTLNGKWDTKTRMSSSGYLKETTPGVASASGAAGAPGLKTDVITTGDQFSVLPMMLPDNSVMLKYNISLSDLLGLFDVTVGSGATLQKVQTPRVDSVSASSNVVLNPGTTVMITGLSRNVATSDDKRLGDEVPMVLGGSQNLKLEREHFLILVRATPL